MVLNPDKMRKAQAELDDLLGAQGNVIPEFKHFDRLPYCAALVKEVLRRVEYKISEIFLTDVFKQMVSCRSRWIAPHV